MRRRLWLGGFGLLLLFAAGCGDRKTALAPVRGQVFFHERPLNGGTIVFTPDEERGCRGPMAYARIGPDGGYILYTNQEPGAVPGWHLVTIKDFPPPNGTSAAGLPSRYCDPERSGESREVKAGVANSFDFHLD